MQRTFHNIEQNTEEWCALRLGRVTASNFGKIMANAYNKDGVFNKNAAFGKGAKEYAIKKAAEITTGRTVQGFTTYWMEHGTETEPIAKERYMDETFNNVRQGGFLEADWLGASSDGLIDDKGGIEIKCVKHTTHFERMRKGGFDLTYKWQIYGNMYLYDLDWIDFVSFNQDFREHRQLYIFRVNKNKEMIKQLRERLGVFKIHLDGCVEAVK